MAKDPKYVRLCDRLAFNGSWTDIESGFSIGGLDVQEFPSDDKPRQKVAVQKALRQGILEEASKEEFDKIHGEAAPEQTVEYRQIVEVPFQEQQIRDKNANQHVEVRAAREAQSLALLGDDDIAPANTGGTALISDPGTGQQIAADNPSTQTDEEKEAAKTAAAEEAKKKADEKKAAEKAAKANSSN